eukprot:GHVU01043508.1.p1 GENE.GHVU01043508.1~~GHVU01043508.1.p1  ORF type:complete len:162 (-),score=4.56 GHVU01043508.1:32-517(-)
MNPKRRAKPGKRTCSTTGGSGETYQYGVSVVVDCLLECRRLSCHRYPLLLVLLLSGMQNRYELLLRIWVAWTSVQLRPCSPSVNPPRPWGMRAALAAALARWFVLGMRLYSRGYVCFRAPCPCTPCSKDIESMLRASRELEYASRHDELSSATQRQYEIVR